MNIVIQVIRWALSLLWLIMVFGSFSQGGFLGFIFGIIFVTAFSYTCPPIHAQIKKQRAKQAEQAELKKMTKCSECKKEISTKAKKCPHCGFEKPDWEQAKGCLLLLILIFVAFAWIYSSSDNEVKKLSELTKTELTVRLSDEDNQGAKSQRDIYQELFTREPDNKEYKKSFEKFAKKVKVKSQFHPWDGSHIALEKIIKSALQDPDSYDHVKSSYWQYDNHIIVKTTYRGKNAYNATVTEWAKAKFDLDGNLLQVLSTSDE